jgi:HTH-type transcriptional regulator / antitoxin HigA
MKPKVIKTAEEHAAALKRIEQLMDAKPGSPQAAELELWSLLVEKYEEAHFPIEAPDPIEAIRFRMEQMSLRPADLAKYKSFRHKSKVSEMLNRKRPLNVKMIRSLSYGLNIPAEVLLQEPAGEYSTSKTVKPALKGS